MLQRTLLRCLKVVDDCAGGDCRSVVPGQTHAIERMHFQLLPQQWHGVVFGENPIF